MTANFSRLWLLDDGGPGPLNPTFGVQHPQAASLVTAIKCQPIDLGHPKYLPLPCSSFPLLAAYFWTVVIPMLLGLCFVLLGSCLWIHKQPVCNWAPAIVFPSLVPPCHAVCGLSFGFLRVPAPQGNQHQKTGRHLRHLKVKCLYHTKHIPQLCVIIGTASQARLAWSSQSC